MAGWGTGGWGSMPRGGSADDPASTETDVATLLAWDEPKATILAWEQ